MKAGFLAVAFFVTVGCAAPEAQRPKPDGKPLVEAPEKGDAMLLGTGRVEIVTKDEEGKVVLAVRAASSDIEVGERIGKSALKDVDGEIFEAGKLKSRFKAERGTLDQAKRLVHADGNVVVRDPNGGIALRADSIRYLDGSGRIEAKGRVTVSSDAWRIGPFVDLWSTPDLQRVATPDRFP